MLVFTLFKSLASVASASVLVVCCLLRLLINPVLQDPVIAFHGPSSRLVGSGTRFSGNRHILWITPVCAEHDRNRLPPLIFLQMHPFCPCIEQRGSGRAGSSGPGFEGVSQASVRQKDVAVLYVLFLLCSLSDDIQLVVQ